LKEIYEHAIKLLARRDYSVAELRKKLETRFGAAPQEVLDQLLQKRYLDDRRYAERYAARKKLRGPARLRAELETRGVHSSTVEEILSNATIPSPEDALKARMTDWNLSAPLRPRDAARLFRALVRLGYDEDAIREVLERTS
jgi:regulatory protein